MKRLLTALLVSVLVLAACGDDDDVVVGGGDDDGTSGGGSLPIDEDGLLVSTEIAGYSIFPPRHLLGSPPSITIYNDGTVITEGAVPAIFPGPAVMPLMKGQLDADEIARIRDLAADIGLYQELELEDPRVTDMQSLVVTVGAGDGEVATAVYAHAPDFDSGLPLATQELRQAIRDFVEEVEKQAMEAETGEIYQPQRYRVAALADVEIDDPNIEPNRAEWPFDSMPEVGGCTVVSGDDAGILTEALADATQITIWTTDDGDEFQLDVRPVLPHEPDCPA